MRDVAAAAGVSPKTVSNVLNDYEYVKPETKARVEAAMAQLGYRMNYAARNLRRGSTGLIGLAIPELSQPYFAELAEFVLAAAADAGYGVLIEPTRATYRGENDVLTGDRRRLTDGLIMSPTSSAATNYHLDPDAGPLVLLAEQVTPSHADHVTMPNVDAAYAATRHLLELGRRRILLLGTHPDEVTGPGPLRTQGFRRAHAERGVPVDEGLMQPVDIWQLMDGAQAMAAVLDRDAEFDAVFAMNDTLAIGAIHILAERGLTVPDDVAVVGFDDVAAARVSLPPLTTVAPGRLELAQTAVRLLVERIRGERTGPGEEFVMPFELIVRGSTRR